MDTLLNDVCVLVTAAFALTLLPGLRQPKRSLFSLRDQGTALLVFLVLGLVEEVTVSRAGGLNERIVAVCAAGLVAGPWIGLVVGGFVTWLAVAYAMYKRFPSGLATIADGDKYPGPLLGKTSSRKVVRSGLVE